MSSVKGTVDSLRIEFKLWQDLLAKDEKMAADYLQSGSNWTLKDILAHLTSWQEVSLARLIAARLNGTPDYPAWFPGSDPETEEDLNRINAAIYQMYEHNSLAEIKKEWEHRFSGLILVCQFLPEEDFLEPDRFAWLKGYPLLAVLEGTLEHHREHRDTLVRK